MNKAMASALLFTALATGCVTKTDDSLKQPESFNPNPAVQPISGVQTVTSYDSLVSMIKQHGTITIPLYATNIILESHGLFDLKHTYAWTDALKGHSNNIEARLNTTDVEKIRKGTPENPIAYAIEKKMNGTLSGQEFMLTCTKINIEIKGTGSFRYGLAYAEELAGKLGDINITLKTQPGRDVHGIGKQQYGYSWIHSGTLTLRMKSINSK